MIKFQRGSEVYIYVGYYCNFRYGWSGGNWRRLPYLALVKRSKSVFLGLAGGFGLVLYGIIATFQTFPTFGRVYAAYGGVFIVLSVLWGWGIDKKTPDLYDWIGAVICLIGVSVIIWGPRQ